MSGEEQKISSCETTKEIWDKLEVTNKGTDEVKETMINLLTHYELFQIKEGESVKDVLPIQENCWRS